MITVLDNQTSTSFIICILPFCCCFLFCCFLCFCLYFSSKKHTIYQLLQWLQIKAFHRNCLRTEQTYLQRQSSSTSVKQRQSETCLTLLRTVCGFFSEPLSVHWTKLRMSALNVCSGFLVASLPTQTVLSYLPIIRFNLFI